MSNEVVDFGDLTPQTFRFKIGPDEYVLSESDGAAECAYKNAMMKAVKLGKTGKGGLTPEGITGDIAGPDYLLLAACLRCNGKTVPVDTVKAWPSRITNDLVKRLKAMSDMEDDSLEGLKKQREEIDALIAKHEAKDETEGNE